MCKKLTLPIIKERLLIINPNIEILSNEYLNNSAKLKCKCLIDNHIWSPTWGTLQTKEGCPKCRSKLIGGINRIALKEVKQEFTNRGYITLFDEYHNVDDRLLVQTTEGFKGLMSLHHLKGGIKLAPFTKLNPYVIENMKLWIKLNNKTYELLTTKLKNNCEKLECKCNIDGTIWNPTWTNLRTNHGCPMCGVVSKTGKNYCRYNFDITDEEREKGRLFLGNAINKWRHLVYERDNYTCQCCGDNKGGNLVVHHLDGYHWCKEKRIDVDNGVTLCKSCHKDFHRLYSKRNNTRAQYNEFIMLKNEAS